MTARDGLYARWIAQIAEQKPLSRQEQLYALDVWSRTQETPSVGINQALLFKREDAHG